jgi:hypothetical protein
LIIVLVVLRSPRVVSSRQEALAPDDMDAAQAA